FMRDVPEINNFIASLDNPFLLLLIGIAFTAIVQSSSAVTSIIVLIAASNQNAFGGSGNAVYFLILGSNIGTCVTALISSVGASVNARRASMIHLLFNSFGAILFAIMLLAWKGFSATVIESWIPDKQWQIAAFHTLFNSLCAVIFLPLSKYLVKLATLLIKDKGEDVKSNAELQFMNKPLLASPSIAVDMLKKDVFRMADISMNFLKFSVEGFVARDMEVIEKIEEENDNIASLGQKITDYLVQVSSLDSSFQVEKQVNLLHKNVADVARVAELAENMTKYIKRAVKEDIVFSSEILDKVRDMCELLYNQYENVKNISLEGKKDLIKKVITTEDKVDEMRKSLVQEHINRLSQGLCKPENNAVFINLVSNLERIGDHLAYMVGVN
ncbi:MAG: Na/Pi cotransporter family protein, partial [Acholeplasmatales bacterium]|nr:Na/Pi cotransporter family protein [Acholeplasmatales bacterium]